MKLFQWLSSILSLDAAKRTATGVRSRVASVVGAPATPQAKCFRTMFDEEVDQVRQRRSLHLVDSGDLRQNLVGLALSGGGIRSATFCLGFLQGLDKRAVDSGGVDRTRPAVPVLA